MAELIRVENLKKVIRNYEILKGINLEIEEGELVSIVGPSGSGKSTLLYILGLLDRPTSGKVFFQGKEIDFSKTHLIAKLRNESIGFVFQFHYLIEELKTWENVALPMLKKGVSLKKAKERAYEILKELNLEGKEERRPNELSGGEQQRVAIARAVANNPKLILADEPTGNLDTKNTLKVIKIFSKLNEKGTTIVIVTHDEMVAKRTKRTIKIIDGKVV